MRSWAWGLAMLAAAACGATAQEAGPEGGPAAAVARASICAPGPDFAALAARAPEWGWTALPRKDALKLQAIPDKKALIQGWTVTDGFGAPVYLLVETSETPRPRRLTCELVFQEPDSAGVLATLSRQGFGETGLGAPRLVGPLPAGGRFTEWAPQDSAWRLITYSVPNPPKKGPTLSRIRFSGVEP
jgi:hypothetical protein